MPLDAYQQVQQVPAVPLSCDAAASWLPLLSVCHSFVLQDMLYLSK